MSSNNNWKKDQQLGMPIGTAANKLRKLVLFDLLQRHGENICFQCGMPIESATELSVEHKIPWLDNTPDLFWDLKNVAFSHMNCNVGAARKTKAFQHGTASTYRNYKCRCDQCKAANADAEHKRKYGFSLLETSDNGNRA